MTRSHHVDRIYKRLHFQSDIWPRELAICAIICMYADMPQPSKWIFSTLTLHILKIIINLQNFSVQSCHHRHKGSYNGELHCLFLQPWRQPYLTRSGKGIDACGMVVHSELYISVSSYKRCFMFIWTNLKMPLPIYFSLYWEIIDFHGLVWSPQIRRHQENSSYVLFSGLKQSLKMRSQMLSV